MADFIEIILLIYTVFAFYSVLVCFLLRKHKGDWYFMFFFVGIISVFAIIIVSVVYQIYFYMIVVLLGLSWIIPIQIYLKKKVKEKEPSISFKKWLKTHGGGWPKGTFGIEVVDTKIKEYENYCEQLNKEV